MQTVFKICSREPVMELSEVLRITNFLNLLNGVLNQFISLNKQLDEIQLEKVVVYALTWALGGLYESEERQQFHEYLREKNCPIP